MFGLMSAVLGIILFTQLGTIEGIVRSIVLLDAAVILSFSMTLLGLLAASIGAVIWASRTPVIYLAVSGGSVVLLAFLLAEVVNINVHGPTEIFLFVIPMLAVSAAVLSVIAAVRYMRSRWKHQH